MRDTGINIAIALIGAVLIAILLGFVVTRPPTIPEITFTCNPGDTYTTEECQ